MNNTATSGKIKDLSEEIILKLDTEVKPHSMKAIYLFNTVFTCYMDEFPKH